jgi:hypothetical protein
MTSKEEISQLQAQMTSKEDVMTKHKSRVAWSLPNVNDNASVDDDKWRNMQRQLRKVWWLVLYSQILALYGSRMLIIISVVRQQNGCQTKLSIFRHKLRIMRSTNVLTN